MDLQAVASAGSALKIYSSPSTYSKASSAGPAASATERTDSVEISAEARTLAGLRERDLVGELFPGIDNSDGVSLTELSGLLREKVAALKDSLDAAFEQAGFQDSGPVGLTVGYDGKILVSGDHPQKAQIEEMFKQDPELANEVRGVSALSSLIRAGREAAEFQKAYAEDPPAAVEQFAHLFNPNYRPEFHLQYSPDSISIYFTDLFQYGSRPLEF